MKDWSAIGVSTGMGYAKPNQRERRLVHVRARAKGLAWLELAREWVKLSDELITSADVASL